MKEQCSKKNGQMSVFFFKTNMILCLICKEIVSVFKDYNLKIHYVQKQADKFSEYQGMLHKYKIAKLKK